MGTIIVLGALAVIVVLAVRSVWKSRKSGCHCDGNCGSCKSCH